MQYCVKNYIDFLSLISLSYFFTVLTLIIQLCSAIRWLNSCIYKRVTLIIVNLMIFINLSSQPSRFLQMHLPRFCLCLIKVLMESDWWQNFLVIKKSCDRNSYVAGRACRNVTVTSLMGSFQITSEIYRIANNLICQASNIVVISHLKQFIGCSLTINHEGHACFMNNQSSSSISRLDNDELLRAMGLFKFRDGVGQISFSTGDP